MNQLPTETRRQILHMLVEGSSMRSVTRVMGVSYPTVNRLMVRAGEVCGEFHNKAVRNIPANLIECDELWAFVHTKDKRLRWAESPSEEHGSLWTFVGIDAESKLILSWKTGDRTYATRARFIADLESRISSDVQITTDGLRSYYDAIGGLFSGRRVDYAQQVKIYGPTESDPNRQHGRYAGSIKVDMIGEPDMEQVTTAHNERHNLTMLPSWVSTSVSNRLMVLVLAAGLSGSPRRPTMIRIVGSWASRSASLVSS